MVRFRFRFRLGLGLGTVLGMGQFWDWASVRSGQFWHGPVLVLGQFCLGQFWGTSFGSASSVLTPNFLALHFNFLDISQMVHLSCDVST